MTDLSQELEISPWSAGKKIAFRFLFIYIVLFIASQNNGAYPFWFLIWQYVADGLQVVLPWLGKNLFYISYPITRGLNGSGDATFDYLTIFLIAVIAVVTVVIWSLADRKRGNYDKMYYWLPIKAPVSSKPWIRISGIVFKVLLIVNAAGVGGYFLLQTAKSRAVRTKMYGFYQVKSFVQGKDTIPPVFPHDTRWKLLTIDTYKSSIRGGVRLMNDSLYLFDVNVDTVKKTMKFRERYKNGRNYEFSYEMPFKNQLVMKGLIRKDTVSILFDRRTDLAEKYLLTTRGFHWINETAFNK